MKQVFGAIRCDVILLSACIFGVGELMQVMCLTTLFAYGAKMVCNLHAVISLLWRDLIGC